jgi:RNA polymerase sigma factor (sigma-70 family)
VEDLVSAGYLALVSLAMRFRPAEHGGTPFAAFARPRIRGAMLDGVRRRHYAAGTHEELDEEIAAPAAVVENVIPLDRTRLRTVKQAAARNLTRRQYLVMDRLYAPDAPSVADTAAALGITPYAVTQRQRRAIAALRKVLVPA